MKELLLMTGIFDRFSGGSTSEETSASEEYTIEDYQEMLNQYKDAEAEVLINIATIYFEKENIEESMKNLEKAIDMYDELNDVGKKALVLDLMGDINRFNKKNKSALKNYKEAFKLYSKIKSEHKDELREKINELEIKQSAQNAETLYDGVSSKSTENIPLQLKKSDYTKISANIEEVIGMLKGADTYISYSKSENPMEELENAYEMSSGIGDDSAKSTLLLIMGYVNLKRSQTDDSLKYFNESLQNFQELEDKLGEAVSRLLIGTAYYIKGDMDMVNNNFRKSIEILRELKDLLGENIAMRLMNAIYED
jgi:tetratricopeptide (TPR) repeat protein